MFASALLRRWYLTLTGVALAVAVTAFAMIQIGPTFKAEGTVLLLPPVTTIKTGSAVETQGNPYLMLGGLSQARDIVIRALQSKSATDAFAEKHPNVTYEVTQDFTTSGPIIVLDVSAPNRSAAVDGLTALTATVPGTLKSLQSQLNLPDTAYITSTVLSADQDAEAVRSGQMRMGIVIGVVSIGGVLLLLALLDGLLQSRRSGGGRPRGRTPRPHARHDIDAADPMPGRAAAPSRRPRPVAARVRSDDTPPAERQDEPAREGSSGTPVRQDGRAVRRDPGDSRQLLTTGG